MTTRYPLTLAILIVLVLSLLTAERLVKALYLLHRLARLEIYGETMGEVGARFIDLALQGFIERPRPISRNRSH